MNKYLYLILVILLWSCNPLVPSKSSSESGSFSFSTNQDTTEPSEPLIEPVIDKISPSGAVNGLAGSTLISLETSVNSRCRYDEEDKPYFNMAMSLITDNQGLKHSGMTVIVPEKDYLFYVKCRSHNGVTNMRSSMISFSTKQVAVIEPPKISNLKPLGTILKTTVKAKLELNTNVSASCRYSDQDIDYDQMNMTFYSMDNRYHYQFKDVMPDQFYRVYVRCSESSGIKNSTSQVIGFSTFGLPVDSTAPIITTSLPIGAQNSELTNINLQVTTNENSTCKFSLNDEDFDLMTNLFDSSSNGQSHEKRVSVVSDREYIYYARCKDLAQNKNIASRVIRFNILKKEAVDVQPPVMANLMPVGTLASDTTQVSLSLNTNEKALCRYSVTDTGYELMSNVLSDLNGGLFHSQTITVEDDKSYDYFVRCRDEKNNINQQSSRITFSVAKKIPADTAAPILSSISPVNNTIISAGVTSTLIGFNTNENASCRYSMNAQQSFNEMMLLETTGQREHQTSISGLSNGSSYSFYVRCADLVNNISLQHNIVFSVEQGASETLGQTLYQNHCLGCHGALANSNVKNATRAQLDFAIQNVASMRNPAIIALTPTQRDSIIMALRDTGSSNGPVDENKLVTRVQFVERRYVDDILSKFFKQDDVEERTDIDEGNFVITNAAFGGACDPYAVARVGSVRDYPFENCFTGSSQATSSLLYSPQRASYTIRACEKYVNDNNIFNSAMASFGGASTAWSNSKFTNIFQKFYTFESPSQDVINNFRTVFDSGSNNEAGWKAVVVGVCISPMWQVL